MIPDEDLYRKLQHHIDRMPVPYPETVSGKEIRILKHIFTPEEAEIALQLSALPEPVRRIHKRLKYMNISKADLEVKLRAMELKGAIMGFPAEPGREKKYSKALLVIGMFEFQVNRITPAMARDFDDYAHNEFHDAVSVLGTNQLRTIPVGEVFEGGRKIEPYDDVIRLVEENKGEAAVMNCVCRQSKEVLGEPVPHPELEETCLVFGGTARWMVDKGVGRFIGKEEVLKIIGKARDAGFVLQPENSQKPEFICCCNKESCHSLKWLKKFDRPAEHVHSNYHAEVDLEKCRGCEGCADYCPMDAISFEETKAVIDYYCCIGCGNCVNQCPEKAVSLSAKDKSYRPPKTHDSLYQQIMKEHFGMMGTLKIIAQALMGMKI